MKIILTFQLLLISLFLSAQCPEEDEIFLSTQSAVDSFKILYPDCKDYWGIMYVGNYDSDQPSNISNLRGLSDIRNVLILFIYKNELLENLTDLDSLESVQGLSVAHNENLVDLFSPESGVQIADLGIGSNNSLTEINNLNHITELFSLGIVSNPLLESINGFQSLKQIRGDLGLVSNDKLLYMEGFQNLEHIGGELFMAENQSLINLAGLSGLKNNVYDPFNYRNDIFILGNPSLESLLGLDSLVFAGGIAIEGNPKIRDISSLSNLERLESLAISGNYSLVSTVSFPKIRECKYGLGIAYNNALIDLPSFPNIDSITRIEIRNNPELKSLSGLDSISKITDYFHIIDNDQLVSIEALSHLDTVYGQLAVSKNLRLKSLDGLENLSAVGALNITKNDSLVDLSAICQVYNNDGIEGQIIISENPACNSVEELDSICEDVGVENHISDYFELLISPNPACSEILVQFPEGSIFDDWEWKLFTLSGDLIKQGVINNSPETKITGLDNYDPGIYFIHFRSESGRFRVKKLIIF